MAKEANAATIEDVAAAMKAMTIEDLQCRHRRERKELQAKIQAIKKNAPKNDKKKRKEAMEEIARMEADLEQRQTGERKLIEQQMAITNTSNSVSSEDAVNDGTDKNENNKSPNVPQTGQRISKAQKRRDKKAREARDRDAEFRANAAAIDILTEPKSIELRQMIAKLKERQLKLHYISSDGDCLYNAVRHQLLQNDLAAFSVQQLRNETAKYIEANKESLIFYMTHPETGDLLRDDEFQKYCDAVRTESAWGGQIELKALSSILKVPIEVLQSEGPPTVQGANEFTGPTLTITYHRHMYQLGEHYNSTVPFSLDPVEKNDDTAEDED